MPKFVPLEPAELMDIHAQFLASCLNSNTHATLAADLEPLSQGVSHIVIDEFLNDKADTELSMLPFNASGRLPERSMQNSPIASALFAFMIDASMLYVPAIGCTNFGRSAKRLRYEPTNLKVHTLVGEHTDSDGTHSVLYNRRPVGAHAYDIDGTSVPIRHNQLTIIQGGANEAISRDLWESVVHSVVIDPNADSSGIPVTEFTRERYLVSTKVL